MDKLLESVALRAERYLEGLRERRVSPSPEAMRALAAFSEPSFPRVRRRRTT